MTNQNKKPDGFMTGSLTIPRWVLVAITVLSTFGLPLVFTLNNQLQRIDSKVDIIPTLEKKIHNHFIDRDIHHGAIMAIRQDIKHLHETTDHLRRVIENMAAQYASRHRNTINSPDTNH